MNDEADLVLENEHEAYREAGHVVMAFLIEKAGIIDDKFLVPASSGERALMVPEFQHVGLQQDRVFWATPTFSLRTLITIPLILLSGYAAEWLQYGHNEIIPFRESNLVETSYHFLGAYYDELREPDMDKRDQYAWQDTVKYSRWVEGEIRTHWLAIRAVARSLLDKSPVPKAEIYGLIMEKIPPKTAEQVDIIAKRIGDVEKQWLQDKEDEMMRRLENLESMSAKLRQSETD